VNLPSKIVQIRTVKKTFILSADKLKINLGGENVRFFGITTNYCPVGGKLSTENSFIAPKASSVMLTSRQVSEGS
jgi:hypothetical protein